MICERANFVSLVQQQLGRVFACIAERAGDNDGLIMHDLSLHRFVPTFAQRSTARA
jgi:hypothetical protein